MNGTRTILIALSFFLQQGTIPTELGLITTLEYLVRCLWMAQQVPTIHENFIPKRLYSFSPG
jgi:hypothetical protein